MDNISTADLCDEYIEELFCADPIFKSFGSKSSFAGQIVTLKLYEDNVLVREILGENGKDKVLGVDGGGSLRCALVGDRLASKAIDNGWEDILLMKTESLFPKNGCLSSFPF